MRTLHLLCLVPCIPALMARGADGMSFDEIKRHNQAKCRALRLVVLTEVLQQSTLLSEDFLLQVRDAETNVATRSGEAIDDAKLSQLNDHATIMRLNCEVLLRRTRAVDYANSCSSYQDTDLRDLDGLLKDNGLEGPLNRIDLSRTRWTIFQPTQSTTLIETHENEKFGSVLDKPAYDRDRELLLMGLIPESWLAGNPKQAIKRLPEGSELRLHRGRNEIRIQLSDDCRITTLERFKNDAQLVERLVLSDYRNINGGRVPFSTQLTRLGSGGSFVRSVERRTVESAAINPSIDRSEFFDVPAGYRVSELRASSNN